MQILFLFTLSILTTPVFYILQVYKSDGYSEYLCQECWSNTKTFHIFYKKVELLQKDYWNSVAVEISYNSDLIKAERGFEPEFSIVKCEETEHIEEVMELQISREESSDQSNFSTRFVLL